MRLSPRTAAGVFHELLIKGFASTIARRTRWQLGTGNRQLFLTCAPLVQIPVAEHKGVPLNFPSPTQTPPLVRQPQSTSTHA